MSAIAGLYYLDGRNVNQSVLVGMLDKLAHRGNDDKNIWCNGHVGFCHRMLWTTPESLKEKLPMVHKNGKFVITADARIDNRDELIHTLNLKSYSEHEITDSELILASYDKWGNSCPENLIGDFAFAIWDKQKQKLFCARDHFGVNPFYYFISGSLFVFASEIKALFCLPDVPCKINDIKVAEYLSSLFNDTSITFYEGIVRLQPAHSLTIQMNKPQTHCYWKLDPSYEVKLSSDNEYAENFREIFSNAVRVRLRSSFPVGSMLSGGLDSSSISCVANDLLSNNKGYSLSTFSAVYNKVTECDERPFINSVLSKNGFEPHFIQGDLQGPLSDLNEILRYQDEPYFAPHLFVTWQLYNYINRQGTRVVLDGFDGDTTLSSSGMGYLHELAISRSWLDFISTLNGLSKNWDISFYNYLWTFVRHYEINPLVSRSTLLKLMRKVYKSSIGHKNCTEVERNNKENWKSIINPDLMLKTDIEDRYDKWQQCNPSFARSEKEEHYRDITSGLKSYALEILNRTASAFMIDVRYPFWDKKMVEFCYGVPPEKKLYRGWSKYLIRLALDDILPSKVQLRRTKTDFSPNLLHGLKNYDRTLLVKILENSTEILREYVNMSYLKEISDRLISCRHNNIRLETKDGFSIWKVITLTAWFKNIKNQLIY